MSKEIITKVTILKKHFDLAKLKYPKESWVNFEDNKIEIEFCSNAMDEYSRSQSEAFAKWKDDNYRLWSTGKYKYVMHGYFSPILSLEELYELFLKSQQNERQTTP